MCGFCFSGNNTEKSIPVKAQTPSSVQLANLTPGMMYKLWVFPIWSSPSEHSYITFTTSSGETGFSASEACHIHHHQRHSRGGGRWFDHDCMEQPSSNPQRPPPHLCLYERATPASPGGCSALHGGGEPQEGMGIPLKEGGELLLPAALLEALTLGLHFHTGVATHGDGGCFDGERARGWPRVMAEGQAGRSW